MKKNTRKQVKTKKVHTQVEEMWPCQKQPQLRPHMKHPQLRFQRSRGTPSNVMTPPTRSKMQEQEEDTPIRTASTEKAEAKRITEDWGLSWRSLHRRPSYRDASALALYAR